jgi:hypothetical protein
MASDFRTKVTKRGTAKVTKTVFLTVLAVKVAGF